MIAMTIINGTPPSLDFLFGSDRPDFPALFFQTSTSVQSQNMTINTCTPAARRAIAARTINQSIMYNALISLTFAPHTPDTRLEMSI
jgi:hypothetical protein